MDLRFLGRGSAFNVAEHNTSAYYIENGDMLLIDCGESVFREIKEKNILNGVERLSVMITHLHPDHAGSLGSLCLYSFFALKKKANIILPFNNTYAEDIKRFLELTGVPEKYVNFLYEESIHSVMPVLSRVNYFPTNHVDEIPCFGLVLVHARDGFTYYSGDTNDTFILDGWIKDSSRFKLDKIYMDTCKADYPGNVHLNYKKLISSVPEHLRSKVYCMHLDDVSLIPELKQNGFNVVMEDEITNVSDDESHRD